MAKHEVISPDIPDWGRERPRKLWDPSRRLLGAVRGFQRWNGRFGVLGRCVARCQRLRYQFWSVVTGAEIPIDGEIGGGLVLPHPNGVVIHPEAKIGPNCLLFQQVTLGAGGRRPGTPVLGGHVDVGAGAKILGGVRVGNHAKIGANAVVLDDVPEGATAVGVPARVIPPAEGRGAARPV